MKRKVREAKLNAKNSGLSIILIYRLAFAVNWWRDQVFTFICASKNNKNVLSLILW